MKKKILMDHISSTYHLISFLESLFSGNSCCCLCLAFKRLGGQNEAVKETFWL